MMAAVPDWFGDLLTLPPAELAEGWALLVLLLGLGLGIGVLTGLFGVGGAFLLNPLLIILVGIPETMVIGSSLSFTIGTGAGGTARHMRNRNVEFRSMLLLGLGAVVGAILGADVLQWLKGAMDAVTFESFILSLYLAMLLLTSYLTFRDPKEGAHGKSLLQRVALPPRVSLPGAGLRGVSLPGLLLVGAVIGVAKGLLGIGGGVLFMPLLLLVVGLSAHQAVGTSLGVVLFSSIAGTIQHGTHGNVNLVLVMSLVVGSSVGVQFGAHLCERLNARRLRRSFAGIAFLAAVMIAAKLASKLI